MSEPTLEDYEAKQKAEWSKYTAKGRIVIDGAVAFNDGDPVPAGHVDRKDAPVDKSQVDRVPAPSKES